MATTADPGSLKRGVVLLKLLASAGARGRALTELSSQTGLPHSSVHRLLMQLVGERLAEHNPETRRYRLGPLAFELGVAGSTMHDIRDLCEPTMVQLAAETGDTIYLVVRSGFDAVCMHRREGTFPVRALVLEVGSRRPLGVGAGGLAVLAAIGDDERAEILARVAPNLAAFGKLSLESLKLACERTRETGAAIVENRVTLGIKAVGLPFRDSMGQPIGALSVAALTQRLSSRRTLDVADKLRTATEHVSRLLRQRDRQPALAKNWIDPSA